MKKAIYYLVAGLFSLSLFSCSSGFFSAKYQRTHRWVKTGPGKHSSAEATTTTAESIPADTLAADTDSVTTATTGTTGIKNTLSFVKAAGDASFKAIQKQEQEPEKTAPKLQKRQKNRNPVDKPEKVHAGSSTINILSLVFGICGLLIMVFSFVLQFYAFLLFAFLFGLAAVILGVIGFGRDHDLKGLGIAGFVMGAIAVGIVMVYLCTAIVKAIF